MTPGVVDDRLGGGEEVVLVVVEALSLLVDYDPVVLAPDDRVGILRLPVGELSVDHVELSDRVGPDIHRHTHVSAAVVPDAGDDDRKVIRIVAHILVEYLRVPLEATTGQDDRTGRDGAPLTVGFTHDAIYPPLVVEVQLGCLVIVENVGGLVPRDKDQVLIDVLLATTYQVGEVLLLKV